MKLIVKFNLALSVVFLLGLAGAGYVSHNVLQDNARDEILQNARIMMQGSLAARDIPRARSRHCCRTSSSTSFCPSRSPAMRQQSISMS